MPNLLRPFDYKHPVSHSYSRLEKDSQAVLKPLMVTHPCVLELLALHVDKIREYHAPYRFRLHFADADRLADHLVFVQTYNVTYVGCPCHISWAKPSSLVSFLFVSTIRFSQ